MENWKEIPQFPTYEASDKGNIRVKRTQKVMTLQLRKDGYYQVGLYVEKRRVFQQVHRLVAMAFLEGEGVVNHIDGNKGNNIPFNLEWCDKSHNEKHAYTIGLKSNTGSNNNFSKLSEKDVLEIRKIYQKGTTQQKIADKFNIARNTVSMIVNRKCWTHI